MLSSMKRLVLFFVVCNMEKNPQHSDVFTSVEVGDLILIGLAAADTTHHTHKSFPVGQERKIFLFLWK